MIELPEEISPCRDCPNTEKGIIECRDICERLKAYQSNLPYDDIKIPDATLDVVFKKKSVQTVMELPDIAKTDQPVTKDVLKKFNAMAKAKKVQPVNRYRAYTNKICLYCKKRKAVKIGLCESDYLKWYKGLIEHPVEGEWKLNVNRQKKQTEWPDCEIEGCAEKGNKRGLCKKHFKSWYSGAILHPTLGNYFLIRPQKSNQGGDMSEKKTDEKTLFINFEQYPDLHNEIKRLAETSFLPEWHMVINLISTAIKAAKDKHYEE